jgi:alpha/beta superfamily hydrolase
MNIPELPVQTMPFVWGAAAGAVVLAFVGFNWGGWVTGTGAEKLAGAREDAAIVASLTPICVARFKASAKAPANLAALKEIKSWERADYVGKGGWATMPGSTDEPNRQVATACAEALDKLVL